MVDFTTSNLPTDLIDIGGLVGLLAYIVIQDWRTGRLKKNPDLNMKMDKLSHHFNDETTVLLTEIRDNQLVTSERLIKILNTQDEILKYGVKLRK